MTMHVLYVTLTALLCVCLSPYFGANAQECTRFYTASMNSYITSPRYPKDYPATNCKFVIKAFPGRVIRLTFHDFALEDSNIFGCEYDYVTFEDEDGHQIGPRLCGTGAVGDVVSHGNMLVMNFVADAIWNERGFNVSFSEEIIESSDCGGEYDAVEGGAITSPNWPDDYPVDSSCLYSIVARWGHRVRLTFKDFYLESGFCDFDYITILDNYDNPIGQPRYCGEWNPGVVISPFNRLTVNFTSDYAVTKRGFYAEISEVCGVNYNASEELFIGSPGYPLEYDKNVTCQYVITADAGFVVHLKFVDFELEGASFDGNDTCGFDYVTLQDGDGNQIGKELCGTKIPSDVKSQGNKLIVNFHSDESIVFRGFYASFSQVKQ